MWFVPACVCLTGVRADAHALGENYIWVNIDESHLSGRCEINFVDLEKKLRLNMSLDGRTKEEAVADTTESVQQYMDDHFSILAGGKRVKISITRSLYFEGDSMDYGQYYFETDTFDVPDTLTLHNSMLFEGEPFHRSLLLSEYNKKTGEEYGPVYIAMIFGPSSQEQELNLLKIEQVLSNRDFIWQGILHIWIGIDHILFLVVLLLPAVLVRKEDGWGPVGSFREALWNILKIVTVFTVAHSITLSLAALEIIQLPSQLVESTIALSIILVGLNVMFPKIREGSLWIIFFFGLFHGMGFASVMGDLPFRMVDLIKVVLAFNIGVEIGQVAIVAAVFPLIFLMRNSKAYLPVVLHGGSICICVIAGYWFVERAFGI